jgi:type I restriction enzyme, R subunit
MVKNVVLVRVINAMTEFKQIIGRGTRVREDYGKLAFTILDYTGSATRHFADPEFDGEPVRITEEQIDDNGETVPGTVTVITPEPMPGDETADGDTFVPAALASGDGLTPEPERKRRPKYYVDDTPDAAGIAAIVVYELDAHGKRMRIVEYTTIAAEGVRTLYMSPDEIRSQWTDERLRRFLIEALAEQGVDLATLLAATGQPDADPFDTLCHVAWGTPLRTRRQRAERLRSHHAAFFDQYGPKARRILEALLDKYMDYGPEQIVIPEALKLPPMNDFGNANEIAAFFGGATALRAAVDTMVKELYEG